MHGNSTSTGIPFQTRRGNPTEIPYPRDLPLHRLFEEQVRRTPRAPAVRDRAVTVTYEALDRMANGVAWELRRRGARRGDRIGVLSELSIPGIAAMLGVLKAGAVHVPLKPSYPLGRLAAMCGQVGVRLVLGAAGATASPVASNVPLPEVSGPGAQLPPDDGAIGGGDLAYVMFTSGTTGVPKAVAVPHRAPSRLVLGAGSPVVGEGDTWPATTSPSFDVSCFEVFGALLNGARLVLVDRTVKLAPEDLARLLVAERATVMVLSAGLFHEVTAWRPEMFASLRYLFVTADVVNPGAVRAVLRHGPPGHLVNAYGPTENGIFCTMHEVTDLPEDADSVPIGRPTAHSTAFVLTPSGDPVGVGGSGELWVGGDGLAVGYHGDPVRTRERFVTRVLPRVGEQRLYRTGDRVRVRADGVLEFLGRLDRQVKLDGHRIELAEVEAALAAQSQVSEAVADLVPPTGDRRRLVAWAVPARGAAVADRGALGRRLRGLLADRLPPFMVPSVVHVLDELPRNANGKVERASLPTATVTLLPGGKPETETERIVAEVWSEVLSVSGVARQDGFLALGGGSLHAVRSVSVLRARLPLADADTGGLIRALLSAPTLAEFASAVDGLAGGGAREEEVDLWAEATLEPLPNLPGPRPPDRPRPHRILLTGATGFLGAFLLARLLREPDTLVHCLVRAEDAEHARRRLHANLRRHGLTGRVPAERVVPVAGDLALPRFGLAPAAFDALARDVDTIVHNGAHVNFAYPYALLRPANVDGTRTVLRLATAHHVKTLHHVSTIDTVGVHPASASRPPTGYARTKWVAERLVLEAYVQGLPVTVHRPREISGSTTGGTWPTDTLVCALVKAIADTGTAPDGPFPLDLVPVDHVADTLVRALAHEEPDGRVHDIANPRPTDLALVVDRLRARGHRVASVDRADWIASVTRRVAADPAFPLTPYLPLLAAPAGAPPAPDPRTTAGSAACPAVDAALIDRYLDHFEEIGFLGVQRFS
ncbi:amino acid adenylation domain-containing protein (plasmid) [Streptomyces sp. BI20]|uniref:amino acid adenylation domain-containing protein n=1 Tax=Streptomyces sp. BI20 TaxID=3403460 RepID=UPI003C76BF48